MITRFIRFRFHFGFLLSHYIQFNLNLSHLTNRFVYSKFSFVFTLSLHAVFNGKYDTRLSNKSSGQFPVTEFCVIKCEQFTSCSAVQVIHAPHSIVFITIQSHSNHLHNPTSEIHEFAFGHHGYREYNRI